MEIHGRTLLSEERWWNALHTLYKRWAADSQLSLYKVTSGRRPVHSPEEHRHDEDDERNHSSADRLPTDGCTLPHAEQTNRQHQHQTQGTQINSTSLTFDSMIHPWEPQAEHFLIRETNEAAFILLTELCIFYEFDLMVMRVNHVPVFLSRVCYSSSRRFWTQKRLLTETQIMKKSTPAWWSRARPPRPGTERTRGTTHRENASWIFSCQPGVKVCLDVLGEDWIASAPPAHLGATLRKVNVSEKRAVPSSIQVKNNNLHLSWRMWWGSECILIYDMFIIKLILTIYGSNVLFW